MPNKQEPRPSHPSEGLEQVTPEDLLSKLQTIAWFTVDKKHTPIEGREMQLQAIREFAALSGGSEGPLCENCKYPEGRHWQRVVFLSRERDRFEKENRALQERIHRQRIELDRWEKSGPISESNGEPKPESMAGEESGG